MPSTQGFRRAVRFAENTRTWDPQQGIAIFSFPEALGLAGVRHRCTVSGEWLVDTRVGFCQSKLCVPLARASRSGEWIEFLCSLNIY